MKKSSNTNQSLTFSIVVLIVLLICLCITTSALVRAILIVDNNFFRTGYIKVDLNGGVPIITEDEFLFEPGMTVEKNFYVENQSSWDVYYKLYFENVSGVLADELDVSLRCGEKVLWQGLISELTLENAEAADDVLALNERREFTLSFHFPETSGNEAQGKYLEFNLGVQAVQTKNNPNKLFS